MQAAHMGRPPLGQWWHSVLLQLPFSPDLLLLLGSRGTLALTGYIENPRGTL